MFDCRISDVFPLLKVLLSFIHLHVSEFYYKYHIQACLFPLFLYLAWLLINCPISSWVDSDGDEVTIASDDELVIALTEMTGPVYKINISIKVGSLILSLSLTDSLYLYFSLFFSLSISLSFSLSFSLSIPLFFLYVS